jgi:hypothetical protein
MNFSFESNQSLMLQSSHQPPAPRPPFASPARPEWSQSQTMPIAPRPPMPMPPRPPMPFGQRLAPPDGRGGMNSSSSYYAQQSSSGPFGFNQSTYSSNSSSGRILGFGQLTAYDHQDFSQSSRMEQGGFGQFSQSNYSSTSWSNPIGSGQQTHFDESHFNFATPPGQSICQNPAANDWSDTGVKNGTSSIDLGRYSLGLDKSNSSATLTDKETHIQTKIWGDPHIDFNANSNKASSGMFNGSLTFDLPGHITVGVHTQAANDDPGVSFADSLVVTQGPRAYTVTGLSEQNSTPLNVQRSNNGFALANDLPRDGTHLMTASSGTGWINEQTHQMANASDFHA